MEEHGINPLQKVIAVVPARYQSARLAGKLLLPLAGKPLIIHTLERVARATRVDQVLVATDDRRILSNVEAEGFEAVMTSADHQSGTDRIAEAVAGYPASSIIVNVQADEPLIEPETIDAVVGALLVSEEADMATCSEEISEAGDVLDPNIVKAVVDDDGFAVYFSRSPVPFPRDSVLRSGGIAEALENDPEILAGFRKHTGIYAYRHPFLVEFAQASPTVLENTEMLEQLRALALGARIKVVNAPRGAHGVDTIDDYERVRAAIEV